MAARSTIVCVGREKLRVYEYGSVEEADDLAASIDPQDPCMIGNAIVEWIGAPKFWLRDRIIVMYMGQSQPLVELVSTLMGAPFAVGEGLGRGFGAVDSC